MQILRTLSAVTPGATTDPANPLSDLAATLNKRSMIIFIRDLLDDEERVISTLRNLRAMGNDVIVLHLMDNAELNFPFNESSEFIDMETSESYLANPAAIRGAYLENLNVFLNDCKIVQFLQPSGQHFQSVKIYWNTKHHKTVRNKLNP